MVGVGGPRPPGRDTGGGARSVALRAGRARPPGARTVAGRARPPGSGPEEEGLGPPGRCGRRGLGEGRPAHARDPRGREELPRPRPDALRVDRARARRGRVPGGRRRGAHDPRGMRRRRCRGRAVRRRHERGRRSRAAARRARCSDHTRPRPHRPRGRRGPALPDRGAGSGAARPGRRAGACLPRPDPRPLPAVVGVRDRRRVGRDALGRARPRPATARSTSSSADCSASHRRETSRCARYPPPRRGPGCGSSWWARRACSA